MSLDRVTYFLEEDELQADVVESIPTYLTDFVIEIKKWTIQLGSCFRRANSQKYTFAGQERDESGSLWNCWIG